MGRKDNRGRVGASVVVQLLYKPSSGENASNVHVGWHQDRHYWGAWEEGSELFTAWVALSDVGPSSGPMCFIQGSHKWGQLPGGDFFDQDLAAQQRGISVPEGAEWREVEAHMSAGGASFHDALTFHASGVNTSERRVEALPCICGQINRDPRGRCEGTNAVYSRRRSLSHHL